MYSVRMRAAKGDRHISGAERLVEEGDVSSSVQHLTERALAHERGKPDVITISVESVRTHVHRVPSLPIVLYPVENADAGKEAARKTLARLKIPGYCIEKAFSLLEDSPEVMRGAAIMDMEGNRLEPDRSRGVRATRMDITNDAAQDLANSLAARGLSRYYEQVKEALVLATKVASVRGTVAELCWSDDPSYTVGYVASKKMGYVRIPHMKREGNPRGGRVFFVDTMNLSEYIHELEKVPMLVDRFTGIQEDLTFRPLSQEEP